MSNITSNSNVKLTKEHKVFLEQLRRSGAINMYEATRPLAWHFDIEIKEAMQLLQMWMQTYRREDPDYEDL